MLYALNRDEVARLRRGFVPEFVGAEMLAAAYRTDPVAVARTLPRPLKPAEPIALVFVARYPETNFGSVYNEGALFVLASFRGRRGWYCLSMPVDDDNALIGGREFYGFPKKLGEITLERKGGVVSGRVVRRGAEILRIESTPTSAAEPKDLEHFGIAGVDAGRPCCNLTSFNFKYFPTADGKGFDYAPRLIAQTTVFRPRPGVLKGPARVTVSSTAYDPLGDVPVVGEPLVCIHGTWDNTMLPGRVVARAWNVLRFLPHAFFKVDTVPVVLGAVGGPGATPTAARTGSR
jgi:acetoacetate decarboxylase